MKIAVLGTGMAGRAIAGAPGRPRPRRHHRHPRPAGNPRPDRARRHGQRAVPAGPPSTPTSPSPCSRRGRGPTWSSNATTSPLSAGCRSKRRRPPRRHGDRRHLQPARLLPGVPPTLFVKDTPRRADPAGLPADPGGQDPQHDERQPHGRPRLAGRRVLGLRLRDDLVGKATVTELLEARAHRHHRPRRHQHGLGARDVPPIWLRLVRRLDTSARSTSRSCAEGPPLHGPGPALGRLELDSMG